MKVPKNTLQRVVSAWNKMAMLAVVLQLGRDLPCIDGTRNPGAVKCRVTEDFVTR